MKSETKSHTARLLVSTVAMFGFGFALVPLYGLICDLTGLNGRDDALVRRAIPAVDDTAARVRPVDDAVAAGREQSIHEPLPVARDRAVRGGRAVALPGRRVEHDRAVVGGERQLAGEVVSLRSPDLEHAAIEVVVPQLAREAILGGLTGDEVARCDLASSIPLAQAQPSLNLGQAVMVYAWELRKRPATVQPEADPTTFGHTRQALHQLLAALQIQPTENLHQWVDELLPLASDRELGLVRQLLRRIKRL